MEVSDFDFELPDRSIALRPARPRDSARLLCISGERPAVFRHGLVSDLPQLIQPQDALVVNDTAVIPARLDGERIRWQSRVPVSVNLVRQVASTTWAALLRPMRRVRVGDDIVFRGIKDQGDAPTLVARVAGITGNRLPLLEFSCDHSQMMSRIEKIGQVPLPPYIARRRSVDHRDIADIQTLFATVPGAVAAPTAGLHFTPGLLRKIEARGTPVFRITLHVGAGTFLPVTARSIHEHVMHAEWGEIKPAVADALNAHRRKGGRIVAVGTTALRLIETAARRNGEVRPFHGDTQLFVTPGFTFRAVNLLLTNFHLPRSTLIMLVSAFAGMDTVRQAYTVALDAGYRFCSFGDACLFERQAAGHST